jgi:septum formation protein
MIDSKIILGSKSPRRKELLEGLGYTFEIRTKDTDESYPSTIPSLEVAKFIALQKASALISDLKSDEIVLCADTVVIVDDQILGKPHTSDEAIQMLDQLSGKTHFVNTGVVIASTTKKVQFDVTTKVCFKSLSTAEIEYYVENYKPYDKAGSYGIQEWIGYIGVSSIEGSYFNVVGLPTFEVNQALLDF